MQVGSVPVIPVGTTVLFAKKYAGVLISGWPGITALNVIWPSSAPVTWSQSTEANIRISGLEGEIEPELGLSFSHETFVVAVNVKGEGPPAPTSM